MFDRPGCEFSDYDDMIAFWGECLGAVKNWNVIVSRHPKTRPGRLDGLRKYGVTLTDHDTAPLVPLCDLYVASVSATIRWALACGIPVINYDAYRLDFVDYVGLEGVVWMNARNEFRKVLRPQPRTPPISPACERCNSARRRAGASTTANPAAACAR